MSNENSNEIEYLRNLLKFEKGIKAIRIKQRLNLLVKIECTLNHLKQKENESEPNETN